MKREREIKKKLLKDRPNWMQLPRSSGRKRWRLRSASVREKWRNGSATAHLQTNIALQHALEAQTPGENVRNKRMTSIVHVMMMMVPAVVIMMVPVDEMMMVLAVTIVTGLLAFVEAVAARRDAA